jgi:hypothetical protein
MAAQLFQALPDEAALRDELATRGLKSARPHPQAPARVAPGPLVSPC